MKRPLKIEERQLIARMAEGLGGSSGIRLLEDLENASVAFVAADGSRILFEIAGYGRPPYHGQHPFLVEGRMLDKDGTELLVLLHADDNERLLELEFVRWGTGGVLGPKWETLQLS